MRREGPRSAVWLVNVGSTFVFSRARLWVSILVRILTRKSRFKTIGTSSPVIGEGSHMSVWVSRVDRRYSFNPVWLGDRDLPFYAAVDSRPDSAGASGWCWSASLDIFGHLSAFAIVENTPNAPPRFRRDYPLNLSISVSGGKESNSDSLSSGERNGISPAHNLPGFQACGEMLRQGNGR